MLNWKFKACTRCGGDLFYDDDEDGCFQECLQCGYRRQLKEFKKQPIPVSVKYDHQEELVKNF
jgi:DNA-directed RNA polymerase subunit RPC12/RpoP